MTVSFAPSLASAARLVAPIAAAPLHASHNTADLLLAVAIAVAASGASLVVARAAALVAIAERRELRRAGEHEPLLANGDGE